MHTMMARRKDVEPYATICAYDKDENVEAFYLEDKRFVLALKWHPEIMMDEKYVDRLFERYIENVDELMKDLLK